MVQVGYCQGELPICPVTAEPDHMLHQCRIMIALFGILGAASPAVPTAQALKPSLPPLMLGEETKKQFETSAGMNFLAGVLLMYLPSEADAYGALVVLMQHRHMRELYKQDLAWLQVGALLARLSFEWSHSAGCCML